MRATWKSGLVPGVPMSLGSLRREKRVHLIYSSSYTSENKSDYLQSRSMTPSHTSSQLKLIMEQMNIATKRRLGWMDHGRMELSPLSSTRKETRLDATWN